MAIKDSEQTKSQDKSHGPVGTGEYVVRQGDCIESIAGNSGHFWKTIWDDPTNSELKKVRGDPNILLPGDRVHIPEKRQKQESGKTEMRHRFRRKGVPAMLRIVVSEFDEPRRNVPYRIDIGSQVIQGMTDAEGKLRVPILPNLTKATLIVGEGDEAETYELELGSIDPIETLTGVQARLVNLGYDIGEVDGTFSDETKAALEQFCAEHDVELPPQGQVSEEVRQKILEVHGY